MIEIALEQARMSLRAAVDSVESSERTDKKWDLRASAALFLRLRSFVGLVEGMPMLKWAKDELEESYFREDDLLQVELDGVYRDLRAVRDDLVAQFPVLKTTRPDSSGPFTHSIPGFDLKLQQEGEDRAAQKERLDTSGLRLPHEERMSQYLAGTCEWFQRSSDEPPDLTVFIQRAEDLAHGERRVVRDRQLLERTHPGAQWRRLLEFVTSINRKRGKDSWILPRAVEGREGVAPDAVIFDNDRLKDQQKEKLSTLAPELIERVREVATAVELRLGMRAGVASVLRRYATRCRRFRLDELRKRLGQDDVRSKKELFLSADAGLFSFDEGFETVLLEQKSGQYRSDIYADPGTLSEPLLVEAKIFAAGRAGAMKALIKGLRQIHAYVGTFKAEHAVTPAPVLLLFRVGGQTVGLPASHDLWGTEVVLVCVDLGESSESGANSPGAVEITAAEIHAAMAEPDTPDTQSDLVP